MPKYPKATNRVQKSRRITLTILLIALSAGSIFGQTVNKRSLLALSKGDHILAVIDPVTLKVVARIPVGSDPHEVIASSDGKTAYVSIYGGGSLHELNVIDLVAQKPLETIDTRPLNGPHGLTFAGGKVWFTAEGSKAVGRYDPATHKLDWSMGTGQDRTHMIYVSPDEKKIYTTNVASATVSILVDTLLQRTPPPGGFGPPPSGQGPPKGGQGPQGGFGPPPNHRDWVQTIIPVAKESEGFDVSPDGKELWTVGAEAGTISIITPADKKVTATIDAKVVGANRLRFTPDGKRVLITSLRSGDLVIYDAASHKEVKRINTGHGAAGILVDEDGSRAFIGCTADDYIAVVDLKTLKVISHIAVRGADGLAWAVKD